MPSIRIGLSTDFNLTGSQIGIGTTNPTAKVEVAGQILSENTSGSGGISTFKEYQGFSQIEGGISNTVTIDLSTGGNLNSLSDEIKISGNVTIGPETKVTGGRLDSLTATDKFALPLGETNNRENTPEAGTTRFNQDFGTLEFFDGTNWKSVNSYARYNGGGSGRAIYSPNTANGNVIQTVQIHTLGNAVEFGKRICFDSLGVANIAGGKLAATFSSSTRGVMAGGMNPGNLNNIDYVTIASFGDSLDFGDLTSAKNYMGGLSSSTRGLIVSEYPPLVNVIEYVEISTLGNAIDFGTQSVARMPADGTFASPTRGVTGGGWMPGTKSEVIDYVTIASKGDAIDFGDLTVLRSAAAGGANSTRGIFMGGYVSPVGGAFKTIDYVTISSTGNAVNFGERVFAGAYSGGAASQTRMVCLGGFAPATLTTMDYIQINTTGESKEFGEAQVTGTAPGGTSDCHGGLGGF